MDANKRPKKARRQTPARDLQPRNLQAVTGGKKATNELETEQKKIDTLLQELQGTQK